MMTKKLRIGCLLCAIFVLFACALSGCVELDMDNGADDRDSNIIDNNGNNVNADHNQNNNQNNSGNSNNGNSSIKAIPSTFQIQQALQAENYFWMRDYDDEGYLEDMPSGAVNYYKYVAARFYDEYGNLYPFNYSNSVESLVDSDDYEHLEFIDILYVQFDSVSSAQKAFNELLNDGVFEGAYNHNSGSNWERAWQYPTDDPLNTLASRIDNVVCVIYADWDDFQDAGVAYDNAAIKAMEQVGF